MRTRMYGGVRGRKTKIGGKPTFVFLLLDWVPGAELLILYSIVVDCFVNTLKTNDI